METSSLTFGEPAWLWALAGLPVLVLLFVWAEVRRRRLLGRVVAPKLRTVLAGSTSPWLRAFRHLCLLGALAALILTMAQPRLGYDMLEVPQRGRDVIIAMDVSRSMLAPDVAPSRLVRAKLFATDLIEELASDRVGLVAFAGSAFLQAPLTLDDSAVLAALDELDTNVIPKGGTNIAAAIRAAEEAFGKAEGFSRALVLVTDGEELDADGVEAARRAAANGIRIFTVGVGSAEGAVIPIPREGASGTDLVRDPAGQVVRSKLDSRRLTEIANAGGGFYTPLTEGAARLIVQKGINQLAENDLKSKSSRRPIERYQWPLAAALLLLALHNLTGERRRVRRPAPAPARAVAAAFVMLLALPLASAQAESLLPTGTPTGVSSYNEGRYEEALQAFEKRLGMEPSAAPLQFNAAAAAYQLKDYDKAGQYFSRATLSEDPEVRSRAEFGLGNTLFQQGAARQSVEDKITDWTNAVEKYTQALRSRPDYTEARENKEYLERLLEQLKQQQKKQEKPQDQKKDQKKQDQQQQQKDQQQKKDGGQQDQKDQQGGQDQKQDQAQGGGQKDRQDQQSGGGQQDQQQQGGGGKKNEQEQGGEKPDQQPQGGGQQGQQNQPQSGDQSQGQGGGEQKEENQQQGPGEQEKKDQAGGQDEQKDQQGKGEEKEQPQGQPKQPGGEKPAPGGQKPGQAPVGPGDQQGEGLQPSDEPGPVPQPGEKKEGQLGGPSGQAPQQQGGEGREEPVAVAEEEKDGEMSAAQARALIRAMQGEEERVRLLERRNFQDVSRDW